MAGKITLLISILALFTLAFAEPASDIAKPTSSDNPQPRKDNFSKWPDFGEVQDWLYYIVDGNNGSISVNGPLPFDNSTAEVTSGKELHLLQFYDADFDEETLFPYNNIFMIGFQGYVPNTERDILWNFDMKIDPDTYGSTGFVIEPKGTFASDGTIALPFDFFGVTYAGEENYYSGLGCTNVIAFIPVVWEPIAGIDPFAWNAYEIRFHLVDSETVLASISINDTEVCQTSLANYGETEIQIWLDNSFVTLNPDNTPNYSYNNKETPQGVLYDNIQAKAKPVH